MLCVMIVDDEKPICDGLAENIPWERLRVDKVIKAYSPEDALESTERPDVLISDIRMPHMTGIQLAGEILKKNPMCKIVFMSAYSDKEYYRSAISLHAVGYIEKPIALAEAQEVVTEAVGLCMQHRRFVSQQESVEQYRSQQFCRELASGVFSREWLQDEFAARFVSHSWYCAVLAKLHPRSLPEPSRERICRMIAASFERFFPGCLCMKKDQETLLLFLAGDGPDAETVLRDKVRSVMESLPEQGSIFFAAGYPVTQAEGALAGSLNNAEELSRLLFYRGYGETVFSSQKYLSYASEFHLDPDILRELPNMVRENRKDEVLIWLQKSLKEASDCVNCPPEAIKKEYMKLTQVLVDTEQAVFHERTCEVYQIWEDIERTCTLLGLKEYLLTTVETVFNRFSEFELYGSIVYSVIQELNRQLSNPDFSIKSLAKSMHFRDTYLSSLFKKKTGTTINHFLMELRMDEARRLVLSTELDIWEIAERVGYRDPRYFTSSFKKHTGVLPSALRGKHKR